MPPRPFHCLPNLPSNGFYHLMANSGRQFTIHADLMRQHTSFLIPFEGYQGGVIRLESKLFATEAALSIFMRWIYVESGSVITYAPWYNNYDHDSAVDLINAWLLGEYLGSLRFRNHVVNLFFCISRLDITRAFPQPALTLIPVGHRFVATAVELWVLLSDPQQRADSVEFPIEFDGSLRWMHNLDDRYRNFWDHVTEEFHRAETLGSVWNGPGYLLAEHEDEVGEE